MQGVKSSNRIRNSLGIASVLTSPFLSTSLPAAPIRILSSSQEITRSQEGSSTTSPARSEKKPREDKTVEVLSHSRCSTDSLFIIKRLLNAGYSSNLFGFFLQGDDSPTANSIRAQMYKNLLSESRLTSSENGATLRLGENGGLLSSFFSSFVGVTSSSSVDMRFSLLRPPFDITRLRDGVGVGSEPMAMLLFSFVGAETAYSEKAVRHVLSFRGEGDTSLWDNLRNQNVALDSSSLTSSLAALAYRRDTDLGWSIRNEILGREHEALALAGLTSRQAWTVRNRLLQASIERWKEMKEDERPQFNDALSDLLRGLVGIDSPQGIQFRRRALTLGGANPLDIYFSLRDARSREGRLLMRECQETITRSPHVFDPDDLLDFVFEDDSPRAWKIRNFLISREAVVNPPLVGGHSPTESPPSVLWKEKIISSFGHLQSETADKYIQELLEGGFPRLKILQLLPGSDLPTVWKLRDELLASLIKADRVRFRTDIEQLEALPMEQRVSILTQLRELWNVNGVDGLEKISNEHVLTRMKAIDREGRWDRLNPYYMRQVATDTWARDEAWYRVESMYDDKKLEISTLCRSLRSLTSERSDTMRKALKSHGIARWYLLDSCGGVFTDVARAIREEALDLYTHQPKGEAKRFTGESLVKSLSALPVPSLVSQRHHLLMSFKRQTRFVREATLFDFE